MCVVELRVGGDESFMESFLVVSMGMDLLFDELR